MICKRCGTYFCWVSWGSEAEPCECGANDPVASIYRHYDDDREPTEDELEEARLRRRAAEKR